MFKSINDISATKKWMYTPKEGEQFFFMHIPKTGGTTFRKILTNHFPEDSYYPSQDNLLANGGKYYQQRKLVENHADLLNKPLVMGHYSIDLVKHLKPDVKVISFFRNPIDRILSHVKHIITHDPEFKGADPNDVIRKRIDSLRLVQSKILGIKRGGFAKGVNNLKQIDCIGILEYFPESISMFNKVLGTQFETVPPHNQSAIEFDNISAKTMSLLTRSITMEVRTYYRAFELFKSNCIKHDVQLDI